MCTIDEKAGVPVRKKEPALRLKSVSFRYPGAKIWALEELDYCFYPGFYGLLGPNGAGKSTLIRLATAGAVPTKGKVLWQSRRVTLHSAWFYRRLGYAPQHPCFYPEFTGRQMLEYLYCLKGLPPDLKTIETQRCAALVNLTGELDRRMSAYSGGMRQRLMLAQAFLGTPPLLVLDEPSAGLDPEERVRLRQVLQNLSQNGCTILLSTHVVSDIEAVADKVLLLHHGKLVDSGSPEELAARHHSDGLEQVYLRTVAEGLP